VPGNRTLACLVAVVAALAAPPAPAAIIGSCTIVIGASGTMTADPTLGVFGSRQAGGSAATLTVNPQSLVCNILALLDCFSISAPAPVNFLSAPSGAADDMTFASIFRIDGGADLLGNTPVMVANGLKTMQVDLTATKSSGIFPAGSYQAQVTVRCE
jgi:hypothetical protein